MEAVVGSDRWVEERHLSWAATIPPRKAGDAPSLYANYKIISQKPRPGARLTVGVGVGGGGGWFPTPFRVTVKAS
jgi:hypothetical protein